MANLAIEIEGLKELQSNFKKNPEATRKYTNQAIKESVFTLLANARKLAPVDQGFLRGPAMVTSFEDLKGTLSNTAPYAVYVHEGTRPHFPPIDAITPWANRHGIPPFLLARSIARKGTKAQPFFRDSIEESQDAIDGFFMKALANIVKSLAN